MILNDGISDSKCCLTLSRLRKVILIRKLTLNDMSVKLPRIENSLPGLNVPQFHFQPVPVSPASFSINFYTKPLEAYEHTIDKKTHKTQN